MRMGLTGAAIGKGREGGDGVMHGMGAEREGEREEGREGGREGEKAASVASALGSSIVFGHLVLR